MLEFEPLRLLALFVGFNLLLQTIEIWQMRSSFAPGQDLSWRLFHLDFKSSPSWLKRSLSMIMDKSFGSVVLIQGFCAVLIMFSLEPIWCALLLVARILVAIRFRGAVQGASDSMTLVTLIGLFVLSAAPSSKVAWWGLWWITIQTVLSYGISGWVKLRNPSWRRGLVVQNLFKADWLGVRRTRIIGQRQARVLAAFVYIPELLFPLGLKWPQLLPLLMIWGIVFHGFNTYLMGLQRFFWTWISTYPAIWFCAHLIN